MAQLEPPANTDVEPIDSNHPVPSEHTPIGGIIRREVTKPEWEAKIQESKWKEHPDYGKAKSGHLALQDHGNVIWFKNIKVRRL